MSDTINDMPTMIDQQQLAQELDELSDHGVLDWSRASIDGVSVRAKRGVS